MKQVLCQLASKISKKEIVFFIHIVVIVILITRIFPRASSKDAHGSQSNDSTYLALICAVVFTSPLTSRLCSQIQE